MTQYGEKLQQTDVKWFLDDQTQPFYQWLPGNKRSFLQNYAIALLISQKLLFASALLSGLVLPILFVKASNRKRPPEKPIPRYG